MKKAIIATISIVLILTVVAVGVTAYASDGYILPVSEWGDRLGIDSDKQPDEQEKPDDTTPGGEIPGGDTQTPGEEIPGDSTDNPGTVVVSPMEINLNWEDFVFSSDYIPTEEYIPQYRQEFKAEILPENTIDKTLIWSAEFVNPTSEWAVGKNVSDYIKLTTEEDTLSAEIECLQPFGEQIIVTVASKRNNKVKDTCLLDFKQFATEYYIEYDGVKVEFQDDTAGMFSADFVCDPDVKGPEHTISIHYALSDTYTIPRQPEFGINGTMYHSQGYSFGVDDSAFRNGETTLTFTMDRGLLTTAGGSSVDNKTTEEIHDIVESIGTGILNIHNTLAIPDIRLKIDLSPIILANIVKSIKVGDSDENTLELQAYEYWQFLSGEGENPMPDTVTAIYGDDRSKILPVVWKNAEGITVSPQDYVCNYYVVEEEHTSDENFIVAEVVDGDKTYTFPMNVKIRSSTISSMQFLVDGEWKDSVTSDMVTGDNVDSLVVNTARVTFNDEYVMELPTIIRPSMTGYGYAYIGFDLGLYNETAAVVDYDGCNLKQAKRISVEG